MPGVAVVTGAGGGIGAATAARLGREGFKVWLGDLDRHRSEETARAVEAAGGVAHAFTVDVASAQSVASAFELIAREDRGIDVLVNNAGVVEVCRFEDATQEMWERMYRINVVGTFLCIQAALPALRAASPGARIINVASGAGKMPGPFTAPYNASKAAVISLTRSAAAWLAPEILVNSVCPGVVDTAMWQLLDRRLGEEGAGEAASFRGRVAALPIQRAATADDVAGAIAFLAGPDGAYVVGEDLNVTGGYVMH
jgi:NAD(P)-dependent dehydrogenase (short-subunit alcohol dehydrogenase family)